MNPVSFSARVGTSVLFVGLILLLLMTDGFIPVLDHANLAFHEAGHPIFGIFGETLGLYGGTWGQLVFPLVVLGKFWRERHAVGVSIAAAWLFQNFINIARYMADARSQILPLVGGGEHDWLAIFMRWGVLAHDTQIAGVVKGLGWIGILSAWAWLIWMTSPTEE